MHSSSSTVHILALDKKLFHHFKARHEVISAAWIDIHGLGSEHASIFCLCVREAGRLDAVTERITQMPSSPIDGTVEWPALTRQAEDDEETI